jgi:Ca2+-binding EF-hand superfamily protein
MYFRLNEISVYCYPLFILVSFQIYDFDGDNYISVSDLTAVVAATLREHKIFILRTDIDLIVQSTMAEANPKHANMISFEE